MVEEILLQFHFRNINIYEAEVMVMMHAIRFEKSQWYLRVKVFIYEIM